MDFDLRLLPAFVALADELHFGRAATRLHIGQPAVSQQLARLERQLGVELVRRDSRRVALTPAGHAFLAGARSALVLAQGAAAAARRAEHDRLAFRLGVDIDMPGWLVRRIRRFGARWAEADLRVTIAQQDDLVDALDGAGLDAVVAWTGPPADASLTCEVLTAVPIHGVVRRTDPLAAGDGLRREDLSGHPLSIYLPTGETRPFYDELLTALAVDGRVPHASHVRAVDDAQEAMLDAVEHSGGYTIRVEGRLDGLDRPSLVALPFDPPLRTDVVILWHGTEAPVALAGLREWLASS